MLSVESVVEALKPVKDPELGRGLVEMGMVKDVAVQDGAVSFKIELTTPACPLKDRIQADAEAAVRKLSGVKTVSIAWGAQVRASARAQGQVFLPGVKNVILVGAGKGGVGKSTVAVNLALALQKLGAKTALLDADVYGPSIPMMLGVRHEKPRGAGTEQDPRILPVTAHGLQIMSMGFFVDPMTAMIWRGPMLHGAIQQFFRDVQWGEQDYLVVDLPPGTGDVSLSIAQMLKVAGAVLVTTPQDVALSDVVRAKSMFDKLDVPVLGLIENMSVFVCPHCGKESHIFSHGGGRAAAEKLGVPFLGEVPLQPSIVEGGDRGVPVLAGDAESAAAKAFLLLSANVAGQVSVANLREAKAMPQGFVPLSSLRA
jgi:ATP-binding protein involved in chromosome partitioning